MGQGFWHIHCGYSLCRRLQILWIRQSGSTYTFGQTSTSLLLNNAHDRATCSHSIRHVIRTRTDVMTGPTKKGRRRSEGANDNRIRTQGGIRQAILDGAHVIIWSFLHLEIISNAEDDLSH